MTREAELDRVLAEAGRATERLARRMVERALLVHWQAVLGAISGVCGAGDPKPKAVVAHPVDALEHAHLCGASGLWWAGPGTIAVADAIGVPESTLRRKRGELPRFLVSASGSDFPAEAPLDARREEVRRVVRAIRTSLRAVEPEGTGSRSRTWCAIEREGVSAIAAACGERSGLAASTAGISENTWRLVRPRPPRSARA